MRLISAHIRGYGRLVDTKVNLDAKVIAIVGPNEAGKTTLLDALYHVGSGEVLSTSHRSRAVEVPEDVPITTFDYMLDDHDREALADLDLEEPPQRAKVSRTASETIIRVVVTPRPTKSLEPLRSVFDVLEDHRAMLEMIERRVSRGTEQDGLESDGDPRSIGVIADAVRAAISDAETEIDATVLEFAEELLPRVHERAEDLKLALKTFIDWGRREPPIQEVIHRLAARFPRFIFFDDAARSLQSAYGFDESLTSDPPEALRNLAGMADLDLDKLQSFAATNDIGRRRTLLAQANKRMDAIFADAWKQSRLSVHFDLDGNQLRLELVEENERITVFNERSAGLRMFVALIAFLKVHGSKRPSILLIDEAESHLHVDAQADLVNMFVTQEHAAKVIYTTHSPACLPPDLGTGIRTVVPRGSDLQVSDVKNSFWNGRAGYSPLMLAMGAAAAAFTPARMVVLAEGATEMILLPTLIRTATDSPNLPYQVAPGLSEIPKDFLSQLDLEASRVVYLVDGDAGGVALSKSLSQAGIPTELIVVLGVPTLESLLDQDHYQEALLALLPECNPDAANDKLPKSFDIDPTQEISDATTLRAKIEGLDLRMPSKVAIANWLVQNGKAIPSPRGVGELRKLHRDLLGALRLGRNSR